MPRKYNRIAPTRYTELIDLLETIQSDECMIWPYATNHFGYGVINKNYHIYRVHRIAFHFANGYWPPIDTRHTCDNPSCFNPAHLIAGTRKENVADALSRGRHSVGEHRPNSKLTNTAVLKMRNDHQFRSISFRKIAMEYGVDESVVRDVLARRIWKHV